MITQERLKELFDYQDGALIWKVKKARAKKGDIAGCDALTKGIMYRQTKIDGKQYRVHCLVFLMHHGYLPKQVDHIDGNGLNNRIENLRAADASSNALNSRLKSSNTSTSKNVYWNSQRRKWMVQTIVNGEQKYFGLYDDLELADLVAAEVRDKFHGQFARHF